MEYWRFPEGVPSNVTDLMSMVKHRKTTLEDPFSFHF